MITAALVVVPGPGDTVTFVRQERGPYAGWWLLPGGKVEFGEPVAEAARRETVEESGCDLGELVLTGAYEILGPGHHFVMWAYRSERVGVVPERFSGHHVSAVRQEQAREAAAAKLAKRISPELLWHFDEAGWNVLGFEHIQGRAADYSPGSPDIDLVTKCMEVLAAIQIPPGPAPGSPSRPG